MKILLVTPFLPHSQASHAVASALYPRIEALSTTYQYDLLTFIESADEQSKLSSLDKLFHSIYTVERRITKAALLYRFMRFINRPKMYWSFHSSRFAKKLKELVIRGGYDLVQFEYSQMAQYGKYVYDDVPTLLVKHDIRFLLMYRKWQLSRGIKRLYDKLEMLKTLDLEFDVLSYFDGVVVLSEHNATLLRAFSSHPNVFAVPPWHDVAEIDKSFYQRPGRNLVFLGSMNRKENIDSVTYFVRYIYPKIKQKLPETVLHIVGGNPAPEILSLANSNNNIVVHGYISRLADVLSDCDVGIAPMLVGGGILMKIIDLMRHGLPVVATYLANEGLGAFPGKEIILASSPEQFAGEVCTLLRDSEKRMQLGLAGRRFIESKYSSEKIIPLWHNIYHQIRASNIK